uniref:Uncharacterized protein n=1 Tax=Glossina pallidipes TaxID=7398 RepID=A0A1A9ZD57_GLOPL
MPCGSELLEEECWKIERIKFARKKMGETAVAINRRPNKVSNYRKGPDSYGCIKRSGHISAVDQRTKRRRRRAQLPQSAVNIASIEKHYTMKCQKMYCSEERWRGINSTKVDGIILYSTEATY